MAFSYSFLEKKTGEHFCLPVSLLTDAETLQNYTELISIQLPDRTGDCLLDESSAGIYIIARDCFVVNTFSKNIRIFHRNTVSFTAVLLSFFRLPGAGTPGG